MQQRTASRLAWSVGLPSIAFMIGALAFLFVDRHATLPSDAARWNARQVLDISTSIAVPAIGILLASRRRENPIGWLFLVAGLALGAENFSTTYGLHALEARPGSLPAGHLLGWVSNWVWPIPVCMLSFLFLLFPTGHLLSRRWRPVAWYTGAVTLGLTLAAVVFASATWSAPFGPNQHLSGPFAAAARVAFAGAIFTLPVALLSSFGSVALRFRRSVGEERLQLKWFATAAALVAVSMSVNVSSNSAVVSVASNAALLLLYAAIGVAVLKYRLYEIDVVISKTVMYGSLGAFITLVYVGLVVGVGTLVGNRRSPVLSALAAAVVAVAFQPVRHRARRLANRVVYGQRATPYEVLSDFAGRIASTYSSDDVLPRMAQIVAAGTGAERAVVWLRVGRELRAEASSDGIPDTAVLKVDGETIPSPPTGETAVPVVHRGELLGAISIRMPQSERLMPSGERLVADVASQAGLVLSNVRLIEELRASRQRLVAAQDAERRKLERNLHDGAQQQLVAMAVKQRLAASFLRKDPEAAAQILEGLQAETVEALENLRDLARGIYPPLLADRGLAAALSAQARKAAIPVEVVGNGLSRYPQEAEAAVYFCCLEALQNVAKYARASHAVVRLSGDANHVAFSVEDDGAGFDAETATRGSGLTNVSDRIAALGGTLEIRSFLGRGTTIGGSIPVL